MSKNNNNKKDKYKIEPVEMPDDIHKPFFAYGIFKEDQLAFSKIEFYVNRVEDGEIHREMLLRDGVPLVRDRDGYEITKGHKIHFISGTEEDAYRKICDTEPKNLYKWDTVEIGGEEFNLLVGEKLSHGVSMHCDENYRYLDTFNGKNDPFFNRLTEFIRNELEDLPADENELFRLQMYYMLLWSAFDRYCSLKYDAANRPGDNLSDLADDPLFIEALNNTKLTERDEIYSAKNASPFYFNPKKPYFMVNYYYTIRCNVVHRGKQGNNKFSDLRQSLNELLDIFDYIIDKTFGKC